MTYYNIAGFIPRRQPVLQTNSIIETYAAFLLVLLSAIDEGDILYMHENSSSLKMFDAVLRFAPGWGFYTQDCSLYETVVFLTPPFHPVLFCVHNFE